MEDNFLVFHRLLVVFNFVAMVCFASVANFQGKWKVGPSPLSAIGVTSSVIGLVLSLYCVNVNRDAYLSPLQRFMEYRRGLIFHAIMSFTYGATGLVATVTAFTQPGCRDPQTDPHSGLGRDFQNGLYDWCNTKKAGSIVTLFTWVMWSHQLSIGVQYLYHELEAQGLLPWQLLRASVLPVNNGHCTDRRRRFLWLHKLSSSASSFYRNWKGRLVRLWKRSQLGPRDSAVPQNLPFCSICQEFVQNGRSTRVTPCEHTYCEECIKQHVDVQLQENRFPIDCPDCSANRSTEERSSVLYAQVKNLLTDAQNEKWWELEIAPFAVRVRCPGCGRSALIDREEFSTVRVINCPLPDCTSVFCPFCEVLLTAVSNHTCDGSGEMDQLMAQREWKRCPGPCNAVVERAGGCRHMTCRSPGCLAHWCYQCGQLMTRSTRQQEISDAVSRHYQDSECSMT